MQLALKILILSSSLALTTANAEGFISSSYKDNKSKASDYAVAWVKMDSQTGKIYSAVRLESEHSISITNPTNKVVGFYYIYSLCAQDIGCIEKKFLKNLEPHTNFKDKGILEGNASYIYPGVKNIWARTQIIGDIKEYSDDRYAYNKLHIN